MKAISTVGELLAALNDLPAEALICATWEGTFRHIEVIVAPNGTVVIDADPDPRMDYAREIEQGARVPLREWS